MEIIEKALIKVLPSIIRNANNSIREAKVISIDTNIGVCEVQVIGTGETIRNIKFISAVDTPTVDMICLLISSDPSNKNRVFGLIYS